MPHLIIEHSGNLDGEVDFKALCRQLHQAILETGLFELGAIRVRTISSEAYAIADQLPQNAFIDISLRIGRGRSVDERKRAGEAILAAAREALTARLAQPYFALSLEVREIDPELSWKVNAIHPRLRAKTEGAKP